MKTILIVLLLFYSQSLRLPVGKAGQFSIQDINLTEIGGFGVTRKARPDIPSHLHTGIDIKPPNDNYYTDEIIYTIADGEIISKRTDGAYAQLIIEHQISNEIFWTVYEHIAGIKVELFQPVSKGQPIARFLKAQELDEIGWQFNHFHFEVLKQRPIEIKATENNPERLFNSYSLICYTEEQLQMYFYSPLEFLKL